MYRLETIFLQLGCHFKFGRHFEFEVQIEAAPTRFLKCVTNISQIK